MMKARQYDRRFFDRAIEPHIYEIRESNVITLDMVEYFANGDRKLKKDMETLIHDLRDAREYGSILNVTVVDFQAIYARFDEIQEDISVFVLPIMNELLPLVKRAEAMAQKYHVAVTNPPYMGTKGMNSKVASFLKDNYPEGKGDLFAAFITKLEAFAKKYGYFALVTQRTWLFISAFEKLRIALLETSTGVSFVELGAGAFEDLAGEVVQSVLFCMQKGKVNNYTSFYCDVTQFDDKEKAFLNADQKRTCIDDFELFPGYTFAMKLSAVSMAAYKKGKTVGMIAQPKKGLISSDNNRFLRLWPEVSIDRVQFRLSKMDHQDTTKRWLPHNKGGSFRRWYGNQEYLINWENNGAEVKGYAAKLYGSYSRQIMNEKYYLQESISWSSISSQKIGVRYYPIGFTFDTAGPSLFISDKQTRFFIFGLLGSCVAEHYIKATNPTINLLATDISNLPLLGINDDNNCKKVNDIVDACVGIAKSDWDSFETSWDFRLHPLVRVGVSTVAEAYAQWAAECDEHYYTLKSNEEELNCIFIDIYSLQNELTPEVEDKDVTVHRADLGRDIRSLISYAVGCMFGRYSLDVDGLAYAGGAWDGDKYSAFLPDDDNCIPITDEAYFEDDIVGRFVEFIQVVYGAETLEENLAFISRALGNKGGSSREIIRNYFLNDFFKDHGKIYQKRPIYWLFDSGKQNGFKALVYMHRWNANTIGNLRVEYLHRMQRVYEKEIARMQDVIDNSHDNREINQATKRREKLVKQLKEARDYDAKIAHAALSRVEIDLDDGVKMNYEKVQKGPDGKSLGILAKI